MSDPRIAKRWRREQKTKTPDNPSPLDTRLTCSMCNKEFWGPVGDMQSERGFRFGQSLLKHIATAHPQTAVEIAQSTDPYATYCGFRLFNGDQNFKELLDEQQAELLNWIDPQEDDNPPEEDPNPADSPARPESTPENTVQ